MTIPVIKMTDVGIDVPEVQEVIIGLWEMFKNAFGSDLNTAMNTPQGQLITSLAAMITDERNQMIALLNQFDPRYAQGIWQDGIGYIYFMKRKQATHSIAQLKAIGLADTVIPTDFVFTDNSGNHWKTTNPVAIESNGEALIDVICSKAGAITATAGTITGIPIALTGLDRVFNEYAAIVGLEEESQLDFEARRSASVALNSKNTNAATYGAVANIHDVIDVFVIDNPTDQTINVGSTNYPIIRNSILVSVVGGDATTIAKTILAKAGSGCSFNGNTEIVITDDENFSSRSPEYHVKFERPVHVSIYFQVQLEDKGIMSFQDEKTIKEAILDSLAKGSTRARIGQAVIASRFICPVVSSVPNLGIISLRVSKTDDNYQDVMEIGVDEYPVSTEYLIKIV